MISGLERIKTRFECDIKDTLTSKVYSFLQSESLGKVKNIADYIDKETEAEMLESYIESNNLYFDDLKFSIYLDEGAEQKVFFDAEKSKVYKLNDAIFYVNWSQYLESLLVHNILFKETKYDLLGFVKINRVLYSVVQQDFITPSDKTKIESVKDLMFSKGFVLKKGNDYIHADLGLIIEDLHEENVLVKDGTLFFIDTVIYLK